MIIFKKKASMQEHLSQLEGTMGFVPTMGALHAGHLSLILASKLSTDLTICSIFVNPTQFNNIEDLEKYPRLHAQDIELLVSVGCDILYLPEVDDIYPENPIVLKDYNLGDMAKVLEGQFRPGHFQGVANVVYRLLDAVKPEKLFMGSKDFQQIMVVNKLIELENLPVELIACETMREEDGLAMSSRNLRLSSTERQQAIVIYKNLKTIKESWKSQDFKTLSEKFSEDLLQHGFSSIDYISLADTKHLRILNEFDPSVTMVVLVAAFLGDVRLIDNMAIN